MRLTMVRFTNNLNQIKAFKINEAAGKYVKDINLNKQIVLDKIKDLNNWYTRIIGLDEVKLYQDRVVTLQEKLLAAQEKRRNISQHLSEIRKRSNDLQDQIHKVKRQENLQRFLELMKEETEILKLEEEVSKAFQECDREEREIFTAFTSAVRDSHEKQRAQVEYTKYLGIILSIVGSLLTFCYSTVKKHDLKRCIEENIAKLGTVPSAPVAEQIRSALSSLPVLVDNQKFDSSVNNDINRILANSSAPILKEFKKNESELKEIKKLLLDHNFFLPVVRELEKSEKELKDIRKILNSGKYVARVPDDGALFNQFQQVSEDSNIRQYFFLGIASIGAVVILRALFG